MIKPELGARIEIGESCFLVVDQEPRNWKDGVGVREVLPEGQLGEWRLFDQTLLCACQIHLKIRSSF